MLLLSNRGFCCITVVGLYMTLPVAAVVDAADESPPVPVALTTWLAANDGSRVDKLEVVTATEMEFVGGSSMFAVPDVARPLDRLSLI